MTDNHVDDVDLTTAWNAVVRGDTSAYVPVDPDRDLALLQSLHRAVAIHYPVPDAESTWQRVATVHAHSASGANTHADALRNVSSTPSLAMPTPPAPHFIPPNPAAVPWRPALGVVALVAIMVMGLMGSLLGRIAWPPLQPGTALVALQSVSTEQEVLALDPEALLSYLGSTWRLRSASAEAGEVLDPKFTGLLGSTRLLYGGPDEALITVEVLPVAEAPSALTPGWAWASSSTLTQLGKLDPATRSRAPATVAGCSQAVHMDGERKVDLTVAVGITACAIDASEILLVTTFGEVLGNKGFVASDFVVRFLAKELLDASIVPTHRFEGPSSTGESGLYEHALVLAKLVRPLTPGTLLRWTGDIATSPYTNSKTPWLKMRTADGAEGWAPGDSLIPAVQGWRPEIFSPAIEDDFDPDAPIPPTAVAFALDPDRVISVENQPLLTLLPGQIDTPTGLILETQFERTRSEVAAARNDPAEATQLLDAWGWNGNVLRSFGPALDAEPGSDDMTILISLHRFADAEAAASALNYFTEDGEMNLDLQAQDVPSITAPTSLLTGVSDGTPMALLLLQRDQYLYGISGYGSNIDPAGAPDAVVLEVARQLMALYGTAAPLPTP